MFARTFAAIVLVLPTLAAASALPQSDGFITDIIRPTQGDQPTTIDQCNTGSLQCCNNTQSVSYFSMAYLNRVSDYLLSCTGGIQHNCYPPWASWVCGWSARYPHRGYVFFVPCHF